MYETQKNKNMKIDKRNKAWKQAKKVAYEEGVNKTDENYDQMVMDAYNIITDTQASNEGNIPEVKDNTLDAMPNGLGDKLEQVFEKTGVKAAVEWLVDGKDCGCDERKEKLNKWGRKLGITKTVNCLLEDEYIWIKEYNKRHNPKKFSGRDVSMLSRLEYRIFNKRTSICRNCNSAVQLLNRIVKDLNNLVDIYEIGELKELKP